jgi:hypothetical protein
MKKISANLNNNYDVTSAMNSCHVFFSVYLSSPSAVNSITYQEVNKFQRYETGYFMKYGSIF